MLYELLLRRYQIIFPPNRKRKPIWTYVYIVLQNSLITGALNRRYLHLFKTQDGLLRFNIITVNSVTITRTIRYSFQRHDGKFPHTGVVAYFFQKTINVKNQQAFFQLLFILSSTPYLQPKLRLCNKDVYKRQLWNR